MLYQDLAYVWLGSEERYEAVPDLSPFEKKHCPGICLLAGSAETRGTTCCR